MRIKRHSDRSFSGFLKRTISAQLHFLAGLFAIGATIELVEKVFERSTTQDGLACIVFGLTSIAVFMSSAAYHFLDDGFIISPKLNKFLQDLDHFSIYGFIAGTYTPFLLKIVSPPWRLILLLGIWGIALFGIFYTGFRSRFPRWAQHRYVYTGIFILMGWVIVLRLNEITKNLSWKGGMNLLAGGLSYTLGAVIYALKKPNVWPGVIGYHEIWHLAVIAGYGFHFSMIWNFY